MSSDLEQPTLAALGFNDFFADQLSGPEDWPRVARVVVEHRQSYSVVSPHGTSSAVLSGRLRHAAEADTDLPRVGDWVLLASHPPGDVAVIERVLERRTLFARRAPGESRRLQVLAANIDAVLVVCAVSASDDEHLQRRGVNPSRLERYAAAVHQSGARVVFVVNKIDLAQDRETILSAVRAVAGDAPVIATSAVSGAGLSELQQTTSLGETLALVGSSGVGKSALTNRLLGREAERVFAVRSDDERGRHTTTHRELFLLPSGGALIDTPGMRELGLSWEDAELDATFDDIGRLASHCRFRDCQHGAEPGCAVAAAIESGELDERRLASRHKLERELAFELAKQDPRVGLEAKRRARRRARAYRQRTKLGR